MKQLLMYVLIATMVTISGSMIVFAEDPAFPYRPTCADPATIVNKPWQITDHWEDGLYSEFPGYPPMTYGTYNLCYINESLLYIQYDWGDIEGMLSREWEDIYSTGIGGESNSIKAERGFIAHFEYYIPSNDDICYTLRPELGYSSSYSDLAIIFNNVEVGDVPPGADFSDARYDLIDESAINTSNTTYNRLACDTWHIFNEFSTDFENSFGEVDGVNRLVSFNFQFANVYIRNVTILYGPQMNKIYTVY